MMEWATAKDGPPLRARAQPGPAREVVGGGETVHVDPHLRDDDPISRLADARNRLQELGGFSKRGHQLVHLPVETCFHGLELIDVVEVHAGQEGVVLVATANERETELCDLRLHAPAGQVESLSWSRSPAMSASGT